MKLQISGASIDRGMARAGAHLALLLRLGPRTAAAYLRIARLAAAERLWRIPPPRAARGSSTAGDRRPVRPEAGR
jgi:hypothetical protein